jgi:tetratricopeptide (TPR) repeat protein
MSDWIEQRPQPVGVFPFPAGFLILPALAEAEPARASLLRGEVPSAMPEAWTFYSLAVAGRIEEALAHVLASGGGPLARYNAFLLSGGPQYLDAPPPPVDSQLGALAALAAYAHGLTDDVPALSPLLDGELLAAVRMMQATVCIERGERRQAHRLLLEAARQAEKASPVFAGQLYTQAAQCCGGAEALEPCRRAARLLDAAADRRMRAEAWISLGQLCQELSSSSPAADRESLVEAASAYHSAMAAGLSVECEPDLYALAQNNLGLTYLAMPMSAEGASLRTAVAVQSFREALKVYSREETPAAWASTQLNLANALQYMHSAHPAENLARAVEIYEEILELRPRAVDPVGHARLLANQANALAHLGIFASALAKATEAHKLLHWHGEPEMAASMLALTEAINQRLGGGQRAGERVVAP